MRRILLVIALVGTLLVLGTPPAEAAVSNLSVTTTVDNPRLVGSLRWALNRSEQLGGTVNIGLQLRATYVLNRCNALSEDVGATGDLDVTIDEAVNIGGNGATIQQTCPGERVLQATGGDLQLSNVRITGGDVEADANQAETKGGGVQAAGTTLFNVTLEGNATTGSGGGLWADSVNMAGSTIRDNTAGSNGGGVATFTGAHLIRSTVTGNRAGEGGGIANGLGAIALDTSVVADNTETAPGTGTADGVELDSFMGIVTLLHATVRGGDGDGPAIRGNTTLTESVVSQGLADAACDGGVHTSNGHNADDDGTCDLDETTDEPDVADVGLGVGLLPVPGSVLVDHEPDCPPGIDRRSAPRPQGAGCEIGAFEIRHRPDGELRRSPGRFAGNDVFNTTGADQSVLVDVGSTPVTVDLRVQNDGDHAEPFRVLGPATNARFSIRYQVGTTNVTAQVVAGTFTTPSVAPGARSPVVKMVIGPRAGTGLGGIRNLPVTFTSSVDAARTDVVLPRARRT